MIESGRFRRMGLAASRPSLADPGVDLLGLEIPEPAGLVGRHPLALNLLVHRVTPNSKVSSCLFGGQPAIFHDGPSLGNRRTTEDLTGRCTWSIRPARLVRI